MRFNILIPFNVIAILLILIVIYATLGLPGFVVFVLTMMLVFW